MMKSVPVTPSRECRARRCIGEACPDRRSVPEGSTTEIAPVRGGADVEEIGGPTKTPPAQKIEGFRSPDRLPVLTSGARHGDRPRSRSQKAKRSPSGYAPADAGRDQIADRQ